MIQIIFEVDCLAKQLLPRYWVDGWDIFADGPRCKSLINCKCSPDNDNDDNGNGNG